MNETGKKRCPCSEHIEFNGSDQSLKYVSMDETSRKRVPNI
jgi:hypothetical protein